MASSPADPASDPLATLAANPAGQRLLALLRDPRAETVRGGKRAPAFDGPIPGIAITGDALIDLRDGRPPAVRIGVTWPGAAHVLADELRRRLHRHGELRLWHDVAELRVAEGVPLVVRFVLGDPQTGEEASPWSDPVLTVRAARLTLDGRLEDPSGDLAARTIRSVDPAGFRRRPAALLHLARLAVRSGWTVEPATLAAARAARAADALADARVAHLGDALAPLLAAPPAEAIAALELLRDLAPELPLADGVEIDPERLAAAFAAPPDERLDAILRALAPTAPDRRLRAFRAGARL